MSTIARSNSCLHNQNSYEMIKNRTNFSQLYKYNDHDIFPLSPYLKLQTINIKNGQNTTNKRSPSLAFLRRSSEGYSLPSSGFNVDTEP